jgi:hypothetical protein
MPFTDFIYRIGPTGDSGGYSVSWLMATEYTALTLYIVALAVVSCCVILSLGTLTDPRQRLIPIIVLGKTRRRHDHE